MKGALSWSVAFLALSGAVAAQSASRLEFPRHPAAWLNSAPLSTKLLQGKGVVLVFFEES